MATAESVAVNADGLEVVGAGLIVLKRTYEGADPVVRVRYPCCGREDVLTPGGVRGWSRGQSSLCRRCVQRRAVVSAQSAAVAREEAPAPGISRRQLTDRQIALQLLMVFPWLRARRPA